MNETLRTIRFKLEDSSNSEESLNIWRTENMQ